MPLQWRPIVPNSGPLIHFFCFIKQLVRYCRRHTGKTVRKPEFSLVEKNGRTGKLLCTGKRDFLYGFIKQRYE